MKSKLESPISKYSRFKRIHWWFQFGFGGSTLLLVCGWDTFEAINRGVHPTQLASGLNNNILGLLLLISLSSSISLPLDGFVFKVNKNYSRVVQFILGVSMCLLCSLCVCLLVLSLFYLINDVIGLKYIG